MDAYTMVGAVAAFSAAACFAPQALRVFKSRKIDSHSPSLFSKVVATPKTNDDLAHRIERIVNAD